MQDRRIRQLVIAVLLVVLALGLLSLVSTALSLLLPLTIAVIGAFAFYKIVWQGRESDETMEDELAETSGLAVDDFVSAEEYPVEADDAIEEEEEEARQRLSAIERAQSDYLDAATPAQEILEQLKSRKQRLTGNDDA